MPEISEQDFRFLGEMARHEAFLRLYYSSDAKDAELLARLRASRDPLVPLLLLQYFEEIPEKKAADALIGLIENDNEVIARSAMTSYRKNHYPGKARLLKPLILSPHPRACRFAVRTLSRAGFADALSLILRELPERDGPVRLEMLNALRYLPDRRCVAIVRPLADSAESDEETRFIAFQVLAELQLRQRVLPSRYFMARASDPSERIRRVALQVLQRMPARGIVRVFIEQALRRQDGEATREKAIRALAAFPSSEWIAPLVGLLAEKESASLKLAVEITFKSLPAALRREGLSALLDGTETGLRNNAAILLAGFHGHEPAVRERLFAFWRTTPGEDALDLIDMLRELGGPETASLLMEAMKRSPLMAYSAAGVLPGFLGPDSAAQLLALLTDPETPRLAKQALLGHWAKRGPNEKIRERLFPWLQSALRDDVLNMRYLALQALGAYPLERKLPSFLDLLERETYPEVVRVAYLQILRALGRDPIPLVLLLRDHPKKKVLIGHGVKILTSQSWDVERIPELLRALSGPPLNLLADRPEAFLAVCVHAMERGGVSLQTIWRFLDEGPLRRRFLALLLSFMRAPTRHFPPLPLDFLAERMKVADAETRWLYYGLLEADGRPEAAEAAVTALLRENDPRCQQAGKTGLRKMTAAPA